MILSLNGIFILAFSSIVSSQDPGQTCTFEKSNEEGICKIVDDCPAVITHIQPTRLYTLCGYADLKDIVCCPREGTSPMTTPSPQKLTRNSTISQQRCKEYSEAVYEYVESISLAVQPERIKTKVDKCGSNFVPFIGVEEAKPREFPHLALIGYEEKENVTTWRCAGSLISAQFVLTAAQCLIIQSPKYIRLGEILLSEDNDLTSETLTIAQTFTLPEYTITSAYNDIGLIKMDQKVRLTPLIRPACLPTTFDGPEMQAIATHIQRKPIYPTDPNNKYEYTSPKTLLKVTLKKFTHEECNRIYAPHHPRIRHGILDQIQLCAGPKTRDKDTCIVMA